MSNTDNPTPPVGGKERTAMQRYKNWLNDEVKLGFMTREVADRHQWYIDTYFLEFEKQQIIEAVKYGFTDAHKVSQDLSFNDYFQSKYQQQ